MVATRAGTASSIERRLSAEDQLSVRENLDPSTSVFYRPRTVTLLLLGVAGLVWYSGALAPHPPQDADPKAALIACALVYLGYSTLQGPSSVMIRPHPTVWRFWHGCCMLYLLGLVYMLIQGKAASRQLMTFIDPSLGKPLDEREYGGDCRLYIPGEGWNLTTLRATLFDEFVIAHTLGWWVKALIMRNWWMLWTCSIGFELMELTFQHWLLNFNECWWDSWILDVAVCNLAGMAAGMWTVKYFGSKQYNWQGLSRQQGVLNKTKRGLLQFTPHTLEVWNWATFSSPLRLFQTLFLVAVILVFELNAFFLKTLLWVPPPNLLNVARLALIGILALPGVKEYHAWLDSDNHDLFTKLGPYAWLCGAILCTEILIIIKFGRDEFTAPFPDRIKVPWAIFGGTLAAGLVGWQSWLWYQQYTRRVSGSIARSAEQKKSR